MEAVEIESSYNGLVPDRRQAVAWANDAFLFRIYSTPDAVTFPASPWEIMLDELTSDGAT